jgi:hypothetical protein
MKGVLLFLLATNTRIPASLRPFRQQPYNRRYAETQELRFGPSNRFRVFYQARAEAVILLACSLKEKRWEALRAFVIRQGY